MIRSGVWLRGACFMMIRGESLLGSRDHVIVLISLD